MLVERGNIVAELVKLQYGIVHRTEVEVRRLHIAFGIVGRVLNGGEIVYIIFVRHDYHSARVLTRGALNSRTAARQTIYLGFISTNISLFKIL